MKMRIPKRTRNPFTKRTRVSYTDMFTKRVVIVIPRSGVFVLVLAIAAAIFIPGFWGKWFIVVGTLISILAIASIAEARHQLRMFRFEMAERIATVMEHWDIPEDMPDLRTTEDGDVAASVIRLSK